MIWSSAADFFAMGGYGFYVWGSFGLTAIVMLGELIALRARRSGLHAMVADEYRADPQPHPEYTGAPHEA